MRILIRLKNTEKKTIIPFNYNTILAGIVYTTLSDKGYSNYLHENKGFKYWSISKIYFHNYKTNTSKREFIVYDGLSFIVSCPDNYFITTLMDGLIQRQYVWIKGQRLVVESVKVEPTFEKEEDMQYHALSPICVRSKRVIDGELKQYDLNPSEPQFFNQICELVVKKYNQFYDNEKYVPSDVHVSSQMRNVKGVRIAIKNKGYITYNRAYYLDLLVSAPPVLQDFLYDCGLGEKTAMGFGCVGIGEYNKRKQKF